MLLATGSPLLHERCREGAFSAYEDATHVVYMIIIFLVNFKTDPAADIHHKTVLIPPLEFMPFSSNSLCFKINSPTHGYHNIVSIPISSPIVYLEVPHQVGHLTPKRR